MKIIHTSDWHLGRKFFENDLSETFSRWGDFVVDLARQEKADAVLIAGDVYDRGVPALPMIELLEEVLSRLLDFTQVIITSGNHDSAQRLGFASQFLRDGLFIQTNPSCSGKPLPLRDARGEIGALVYGIPYLDPDTERSRLAPGKEPLERSHTAVMKAACELVRHDITSGQYARLAVPRIAMAHTFVNGSEKSDSESDLSIGGVESVPANVFRLGMEDTGPLNYVALGHLHGPQKVGQSKDPLMRYSGSPIPLSFSEENHRKSTALIEFSSTGKAQIELIEHTFYRKLKTLRGTIAQLLNSPEFDSYQDYFVRLEVTEPERPRDLVATLRRRYPHLVHVNHIVTSKTTSSFNHEMLRAQPLKVIEMFFAESGGRSLNQAELDLIRDIWEESTHENEASK